jgi:hypothetical protein
MGHEEDTSDRRRAGRVDTDGSLRAQLFLEADVLALSSRGMMIRLAFAPELGSRHGFTLTFGGNVLSLLGTVRNSEPYTESDRSGYRVGVQFEGIERHEEEILERFVESKLGR